MVLNKNDQSVVFLLLSIKQLELMWPLLPSEHNVNESLFIA
jgi:hypothetical protein